MKPHKHAELIKAWVDGAEIEVFDKILNSWFDVIDDAPIFFEHNEYRIKPEPKPDVEPIKFYCYIYNNAVDGKTWFSPTMLPYADSITCQYIGKVEVLK